MTRAHSIRRQILGPIILLIAIGMAAAAWISYAAIHTHQQVLEQEELAHRMLRANMRTQDAFRAANQHLIEVTSFNEIIPPAVIEEKHKSLATALWREMAVIRSVGALAEGWITRHEVDVLHRAIIEWEAAAAIALGVKQNPVVPTAHHLTELAGKVRAVKAVIREATLKKVKRSAEAAQSSFVSHMVAVFAVMLTIFAIVGGVLLARGQRLAHILHSLASAMEQIRGGDFKATVKGGDRGDEIGDIARGVAAFATTLRDLTGVKDRIEHMALHDQLTGLPNRRALEGHLRQLLVESGDDAGRTAVLHVDLDRFKHVNDTLGHAAGDGLLKHVASAMRALVKADDLVARVGGDEFVVILSNIADADHAGDVAQRLIDAVSQPMTLGDEAVSVGASVGIALSNRRSDDVERLLSDADIALYVAKGAGRGQFRYYSDETRINFERDMSLLRALRSGLERGEVFAHFQPQVNDVDDTVIGFEALTRWAHPERGILSPEAFINLAFEHGLGDRITETVIESAVSALSAWRAAGLSAPCVSVNLAAKQLRDQALAETLDDVLMSAGLAPTDLSIEVVESVLFGDDVDPALDTIRRLKDRGYRIELDDFGTGHASISSLRRFQVDRVKIDRGFVSGVDTDDEQAMITHTMVDLCRNLGIDCLAEGVETEGERARLRAMGCSRFQGFHVARPMSQEDAASWLRQRAAAPGNAAAV